MPHLCHPPIQRLIQSLPVAEHSVEIRASIWHQACSRAGCLAEHEAIFAGNPTVRISRQWLRTAVTVPSTVRCLAILLWGYPRGARGALHQLWLEKLPVLTATALAPRVSWYEYYDALAALGGLGPSTITKLACFLGHTFNGQPALILDQRILRVLATGRWAELAPLRDLSYQNARQRYPDYLGTLATVAAAGGFAPEQIEYFLFSLGESF
jgi:hypothetical protein